MADATKQPEKEYQILYDKLVESTPNVISFRGKKKKIHWLHKHTQRKFSHIVVSEDDIGKRNVKLCACVLTNNWFAWFFPIVYAIRWRWYYYVIDLDDMEVLKVIDAAKKKIQYYQSELITMLSTGMMDTVMAMTKKEAQAIQAGQAGARPSR